MAEEGEGEEEEGILLYYKYASIPDVDSLVRFYDSNCASLRLLGRVRIAPHGVNVTIGGRMSSLQKHISAVKSDSLFEGTDFKLASCHRPSDHKVAKESGFTSLSIRVVKELVTFSTHPLLMPPTISNAGKHLSAVEFHSLLQTAGNSSELNGLTEEKQLVLFDARNIYETRIGMFQAPNIETLDPKIRQYSDLPDWIDHHSDQLQGKTVLMYCTGGIRCEMASAYIRSKGQGFENVYQLFGGIQRYMEEFPDGGFFSGKNFVFDHRISVGSLRGNTMGSCLLCASPFDDYSSRCRCSYCRMLVLVCDTCQNPAAMYICELCQKHGKTTGQMLHVENDRSDSKSTFSLSGGAILDSTTSLQALPSRQDSILPKKLRVLCLHGFRQNASSFKGRTASLAKKLKSLVEFVFIDAPHELPFVYQACSTRQDLLSEPSSSLQSHDFRESVACYSPPPGKWKKRFAWLVASRSNSADIEKCQMAEGPFDPLQYRQQMDGLEESLSYLKRVVSEVEPFDGVLGFSQGATMAAVFCADQRNEKPHFRFRFAILCSGFGLSSLDVGRGSINCPSLHIFGSGEGKDRQIGRDESIKLANLFEEGCSVVIEHEAGHIIPTWPPYIDHMKAFLRRFI